MPHTVFLPMCADVIHVGHVNILNTAALKGDVTVLLMTDDAMRSYKREPAMAMAQREAILMAMTAVKAIIPCDGLQCFLPLVIKHKPDFFVHGDDWKVGAQAEARQAVIFAVKEYGGTVVEPEYTKGVSSTSLQNDIGIFIDEQKKLGILLRTALNDLKRTPAVVAGETHIGETVLNRVLSGKEFDAENVAAVCRSLAMHYPVDKKHLLLNHDSSTTGMWHMSKEESTRSARIFDRTNANGDTGPYYNYMDTAAAALAPFKPKLIEMLVEVEDNEPMNPLVVMNRGRLLAQLTFFIGPVNYYCTIRGERQCHPMNTGDSCLITPYVPHSFTTRDSSQYSAIVAVTFSTGVRDVLQDLILENAPKLIKAAGDARDPATCHASRRRRAAELRGLSDENIESLLSEAFPTGGAERTQAAEDAVLSSALNVPLHFLSMPALSKENECTYTFVEKNPEGFTSGAGGKNIKRPLASAMHISDAGGYHWQVAETGVLDCQYFNYIYNYGATAIRLAAENESAFHQSCTLAQGDSCVLKPFTKVSVTPKEAGAEATLLVVKAAGCVRTEILDELSTFAAEGRARMLGDLDKWW